MQSGQLRADNRIISFESRGTLTMTGCRIGSSDTVDGEIVLGDAATAGSAHVFQGCQIVSDLADPFTRSHPMFESGCSLLDNGATSQRGVRMALGEDQAFFLENGVMTLGSTTDFDVVIQALNGLALQVGDLDPVAAVGEIRLQS
ncbi:hypothetical protein LCGC14_3005770, partial [marine sediment metagenome]